MLVLATATGELRKSSKSLSYCAKLIELCENLSDWIDEMSDCLFSEDAGLIEAENVSGASKALTPAHRGTQGRANGHQTTGKDGGKYLNAKKQALDDHECIWDGEEFLHIFETRFSLNITTVNMYQTILDRLIEEQENAKEDIAIKKAQREEQVEQSVDHDESQKFVPIISNGTISFLRRYLIVLEFMLRREQNHANDFRIVIKKIDMTEEIIARSASKRSRKSGPEQIVAKKAHPVTFHIWCMTAAVVFEDIVSATHSIILTSGTPVCWLHRNGQHGCEGRRGAWRGLAICPTAAKPSRCYDHRRFFQIQFN
jgi:hypothetical protein